RGCADYFGVKSYLHNFYETHVYKDPDIYEDDAGRYLLSSHGSRRHRCAAAAVWWKVFVWIGANFLAFGVVGVLVGYLVPQKPVFVGAIADNVEVIDRGAVSFNFNLDVCKLVGLVLFCVGGLTLTVALIFPSFLNHYCGEDDRRSDDSFKVCIDNDTPPTCPMELSVPATGKISSVQPERKPEEAMAT
ncbi:Neurensin-1, partial [Lamellibrachia satsuma]